ncbi:hypothetical protein BCS42_08290 [Crenothrix sp. D3]|nr:hypothetical protein BCS42_08290 [Crenothrix sp. D3]
MPADLNIEPVDSKHIGAAIFLLEVEEDEMWSFVGNKDNKQWIWIAIDVHTRQVIAFHIGSRDKDAAREPWQKIPVLFSTDTELNALSLHQYYKAQFQIEFLFRDAKQFTGLGDLSSTFRTCITQSFQCLFHRAEPHQVGFLLPIENPPR